MMLLETLPVAFSGTNVANLPKVQRVDPIMPAQGAIALYEPGHPLSNYTLGLSTSAANPLPNLAVEQAKLMMPAATSTDLQAAIYFNASYVAAGAGKIERSGKGGIHYISSQATPGDANRTAEIRGPISVVNYVAANTSHSYYFSMWVRVTRAFSRAHQGGSVPNRSNMVSTDPQGVYGFYRRYGTTALSIYPQGATQVASREEGLNLTAPGTSYASIQRAAGMAAPSGNNWYLYRQGNAGLSSTDWGISDSSVFYRFYAEDLTVSGRSHATVDAIDFNLYNQHVKTVGGRYYGDTFTDPATIP